MHVHAFVTEKEWEGKEDRDRHGVGGIGIGRRNKRRKQKDDRRGMSDGDNEWEIAANSYTPITVYST